ncbi:MAG: sigma-70 family RNA polymerase sigma factor [Oceanospirillaceae bacterium]|nr:sigma-70 family RNA polymerase sigma factor [Oceanospirillaceae bacterium]
MSFMSGDSLDRQAALEKCLRGCSQGKHTALKQLYELCSANLFSVALRILKDRALSEDCLQQVFYKVWNNAASYDSSKARALTWLNTITRNQALDILRKNKHSDKHDTDDALNFIADDAPSHEQQVALAQDSAAMHKCLAELPKQQKIYLEMAFFEGLTHQALSEKTGTSLGTVKTWIRRGLERLRKCMITT